MSAYFAPLLGGIMIGVAAAMLLLLNGRIAGISGILGGLVGRVIPRPAATATPGVAPAADGDSAWRIAFLAGLVAAPLLYSAFATLPAAQVDAGTGTLVVAGLLVGLGTRYASGCTSGHGICGLSRLSPRSLAATLTFMAAGFATVAVVRGLL
ncbi:YeeE/YedE family protein [Pseudoduganella sp. DS3]|uniref:YeeE/YedE family protein n=1 Tax=Pseudoduganella guangdongensis TaxID=2692179 RepID=A0A6N9HDX1_9BURK|nr:YeeE/YedE family protein [Pseudoduganella guangdongensis]MYN01447.1 YeeE/YedE family protein [Pseudoduganella guangdongensis]